MNLSTRRHPLTAVFMAVIMFVTSLPLGAVHAGMVTTKTMIEQEKPATTAPLDQEASRERIRDFLARDGVRDEMIALGIAPGEAEARIAALTDDEVADIAGRLDQLPAGGIDIGTIVVIMFILFGIAVIMDALGFFDIFPFVCSGDQCRAGAAQVYYPAPAAEVAPVYPYETNRSAYPRDNAASPQYYQPPVQAQPVPQASPGSRNYWNERYGTQRYVR
ncbi:MAG: PA2779 family protein [Geminicoccaceae bacterium]